MFTQSLFILFTVALITHIFILLFVSKGHVYTGQIERQVMRGTYMAWVCADPKFTVSWTLVVRIRRYQYGYYSHRRTDVLSY